VYGQFPGKYPDFPSDLCIFYLDKFQSQIFGNRDCFADAKHIRDDVVGRIAEPMQMVHNLVCVVQLAVTAMYEHVANQLWMRFVAHLQLCIQSMMVLDKSYYSL
jgi:hypothetical protein